MAQIYEKYLIIKAKEEEQKAPQKKKRKKDPEQGISNPRYYENALSPKKAMIKRDLNRYL